MIAQTLNKHAHDINFFNTAIDDFVMEYNVIINFPLLLKTKIHKKYPIARECNQSPMTQVIVKINPLR